MTVRINKQKINLREKLTEFEDRVNFDEVVRGLGEYSGNVGIGVTSPDYKFQVKNNGASNSYAFQVLGGNTDGNRIAGIMDIYVASTDRSAGALALNESDSTTSVFLSAYPDQDSYINNGGNVGIGTTSPGQKLVVESDQEDWVTKLINTNDSPSGLAIQFTADIANASNDFIRCFKNTSDIRFRVYSNGTVLANATEYASDDRVKHNEQAIVGAIETLGKITPKKYIKTTEMYEANHDFELDADGNPVDADGEPVEHSVEAGVIAQQVLEIPELAFMVSPESVDEDGNVTSPHGLNYNSLFTYAIAAIQEQQAIIEDLKSRIETLESK